MKKIILQWGLLAILGLLSAVVLTKISHAVNGSSCNPSKISTYIAIGWADEPFDGNDAPFKAIRRQIDALAAKGNDMVALANAYKKTARTKPEDAQAQFRWGYAAFLASDYEKYVKTKPQILCGVYAAMGQPKNPKSFEYARLRFLVGSINSSYDGTMSMKQLGIRLLRHAPKDDFDLRYLGISALGYTASFKNPEPLEKCLQRTLELQKDFPKRIEPTYMMAGIYSSQFAITKKANIADKSLRYYRQYLQKAPKDYIEWRDWVEDSIQMVEEIRKSYQQQGELKP